MRITAQGLGHQFPNQPFLFRNVSFEFVPGDLIGLTGPSGSGKSTLLSILAGWVTATEGTLSPVGIEHTAWVLQNPFGVPDRSALDHVTLPLLGMGLRRSTASVEALAIMDRFGIAGLAHQPFKSLSGGESQRLMLARAIAGRPSLLLVDEPTAQLDLTSAETVNNVLGELAGQNTIVVVATHDPHTRESCDRIIDLTAIQTAGPEVVGHADR